MRRPPHEIEAQVPHRPAEDVPELGSRPQIRRQVERICEALGLIYDDLIEFHMNGDIVTAILYDRNESGDLYRDEYDRVAIRQDKFIVDTVTFVGDEGDV